MYKGKTCHTSVKTDCVFLGWQGDKLSRSLFLTSESSVCCYTPVMCDDLQEYADDALKQIKLEYTGRMVGFTTNYPLSLHYFL